MFENCHLRIGEAPFTSCMPLSAQLLGSLYALPQSPEKPLREALDALGDSVPWAESFAVAPEQTTGAVGAMLRHMMPRESGVIVNNASVLGWRAQKGQAHYAAAKAGVMALTRCSAVEAAEAGVRINAVAPSLAMHAFLEKVTPPGLLEQLQQREAFGRAAEPFEVANVIVFLASDLSSYMTGEVVAVSSQHP